MATGYEVTVYVSEGEEVAIVPADLVGKSEEAVRTALENAGLKLGTINSRNDPELAAGIVISTDPEPGDEVALGSTVTLVVASGKVTIRDYTATYTVASATTELKELGLTVEEQPNDTCPAKDPTIVLQQSLAPGDVPVSSTVTLSYCSGPTS